MKTKGEKHSKLTRKSKIAQKGYEILNYLPFITLSKKYCVTISDERKFIWYRVAKVGTRTIYNAVKEANVSLSVEHAYDVYVPIGCFEDYFKFAFVRNPFDRLVSCWLNKVVGRKKNTFGVNHETWQEMQTLSGFIDYVETLDLQTCNVHLRSQSSLIDLSVIDYVGRMETFSADCREVFNLIGVELNTLESKNKTKSRTRYQDYYNEDDVQRVYKLYQKDCQIFGYSF